MAAHPSREMRELVLACARALVQRKAAQLRSGWLPIFALLATAAQDKEPAVVELGWAVAAETVGAHLAPVLEGAAFLPAVGCVQAFATQRTAPAARAQAVALLGGALPALIGGAGAVGAALQQLLAHDGAALPYLLGHHHDGNASANAHAGAAAGAGTAGAHAPADAPVAAAAAAVAAVHAPPAHQRPLSFLPPVSALMPPAALLERARAQAAAAAEGGALPVADALYWPLLAALVHCAAAAADDGKAGVLDALFGLLQTRGLGSFEQPTWRALLRDLLTPLYANKGTDGDDGEAAAEAAASAAGVLVPRGGVIGAGADASAWACGVGVLLLQRFVGLVVSSGAELGFLVADVSGWLLGCLASPFVPLVHAAAECLTALLVACTPELPSSAWASVVRALTAAVHRARTSDSGMQGAADTLPGGLRAFLLSCCTHVRGFAAARARAPRRPRGSLASR
jgi:hypothetical protein